MVQRSTRKIPPYIHPPPKHTHTHTHTCTHLPITVVSCFWISAFTRPGARHRSPRRIAQWPVGAAGIATYRSGRCVTSSELLNRYRALFTTRGGDNRRAWWAAPSEWTLIERPPGRVWKMSRSFSIVPLLHINASTRKYQDDKLTTNRLEGFQTSTFSSKSYNYFSLYEFQSSSVF